MLENGMYAVSVVRSHRWTAVSAVLEIRDGERVVDREALPARATLDGETLGDLGVVHLFFPGSAEGERSDPHVPDGSCLFALDDGHLLFCEHHEGRTEARALVGDLYVQMLLPAPRRLLATHVEGGALAWALRLETDWDVPEARSRDRIEPEDDWEGPQLHRTSGGGLAVVTHHAYVTVDLAHGTASRATPDGATGQCVIGDTILVSVDGELRGTHDEPLAFHRIASPGPTQLVVCEAMIGDGRPRIRARVCASTARSPTIDAPSADTPVERGCAHYWLDENLAVIPTPSVQGYVVLEQVHVEGDVPP